MKKKILLGSIFIIVFIGALVLMNYCRLGYLKNNVMKKSNSTSEITFNVKKGDNINVIYTSNIKEGTVTLKLIDPNDDQLTEFEINGDDSSKVSISTSGIYVLSLKYSDFIGDYKIKVQKSLF